MNKKTIIAGLLFMASHVQAAEKALTFGSQGIVSRFSESVSEYPYWWAAGTVATVGAVCCARAVSRKVGAVTHRPLTEVQQEQHTLRNSLAPLKAAMEQERVVPGTYCRLGMREFMPTLSFGDASGAEQFYAAYPTGSLEAVFLISVFNAGGEYKAKRVSFGTILAAWDEVMSNWGAFRKKNEGE